MGIYKKEERQIVVDTFLERLATLGKFERDYFTTNCHVCDCNYNEEIHFKPQDIGGICYFINGLGAVRIYDYGQQKVNYLAFYRPYEPYFIETLTSKELIAFDDNVVYLLLPPTAVNYLRQESVIFNQILLNDLLNLLKREQLFNIYCYITPLNLRVERILLYLATFYGISQEQTWLRLPRRIDQQVLASFARVSLSLVNQVSDELCHRGILRKGRRKLLVKRMVVEKFSRQAHFTGL